ncbi:MAG: hypothetical protein ACYC8T_03050 [Myxococcaceae bacterium]
MIPLCCLALAACDGGWSLKDFAGKSLVLHATDPAAPAYDLVLEYDSTTAKGCGRIGGASATQDGATLTLGASGHATDGGDVGCAMPWWKMNRGVASEPYTTLKLEDGSEKDQLVLRNLFAARAVTLKSAASGKVGDVVTFEFLPDTDSMAETEISFLAAGAVASDKVIWLDPFNGQATLEKNTVKVVLPARQSPATGKVTFTGIPKPAVFACEGFTACRTEGLRLTGEFAFTVTP